MFNLNLFVLSTSSKIVLLGGSNGTALASNLNLLYLSGLLQQQQQQPYIVLNPQSSQTTTTTNVYNFLTSR